MAQPVGALALMRRGRDRGRGFPALSYGLAVCRRYRFSSKALVRRSQAVASGCASMRKRLRQPGDAELSRREIVRRGTEVAHTIRLGKDPEEALETAGRGDDKKPPAARHHAAVRVRDLPG